MNYSYVIWYCRRGLVSDPAKRPTCLVHLQQLSPIVLISTTHGLAKIWGGRYYSVKNISFRDTISLRYYCSTVRNKADWLPWPQLANNNNEETVKSQLHKSPVCYLYRLGLRSWLRVAQCHDSKELQPPPPCQPYSSERPVADV